ncbi:MAG TPA: metallophosphoesterase family protein, partial [Polyangiales bacterium]|nr:metallophosphoesterase family protein [Polyangiales bacterium]
MGRARAAAHVGTWVQQERSLPLREGNNLRLACVADTHSNPHPNTHALLRTLAPDAILHGGDIGDLAVLEPLAAIAPLLAVRGNIDERANELPDGLTIHVKAGGDTALTMLLM